MPYPPAMARGAQVLQFEIEVADVDRGVYETLSFPTAQHPSESDEYVVARVLARVLEHEDGIGFTAGLSTGEEPPVEIVDLTGRRTAWIDVGTPTGARLHKANKATDRVVVYCHKPAEPWLRLLARETVHGAERIRLNALPTEGVAALATGLGRRNRWALSRSDGVLYLDDGSGHHELTLRSLGWPQA